jgi:hypothetical protein
MLERAGADGHAHHTMLQQVLLAMVLPVRVSISSTADGSSNGSSSSSGAAAAAAAVCSHQGHPAQQHRSGVVRGWGTNATKTLKLGPNTSTWGSTCGQACCSSGSGVCRFWSAANGECQLFRRYAQPTSRNNNPQISAGATSGVVYYGATGNNPYSALKGFNYFPASSMNDIDFWRDYDTVAVKRELGWAAAAGFNFCRTWFNFVVWQAEGASSVAKLQHFVATAHALGIQVMIAPFNSYHSCVSTSGEVPAYNFTAPCFYTSPAAVDATHNTTWWHTSGHVYIDALTAALPASTPGLLLWDVCNEPASDWINFVVHFVHYFKNRTTTPTTVGVTHSTVNRGPIGDAVDVLSFHTYFPTWESALQNFDDSTALSEQLNKPVFLSEFGCIARANPYDQGIEVASLWGMGWTLWELMVLNRESEQGTTNRRNIHGLIYSDGSVRDTAAIAAVRGFFVNRGERASLAPGVPNEENHGTRAIESARAWLAQPHARQLDDFLTAATALETIANLLEASSTTPTSLPVSGFARQILVEAATDERRAILSEALTAQADALQATMDGPVGTNSRVAGHHTSQYDTWEPGIAIYHRPYHGGNASKACCGAHQLALCGESP